MLYNNSAPERKIVQITWARERGRERLSLNVKKKTYTYLTPVIPFLFIIPLFYDKLNAAHHTEEPESTLYRGKLSIKWDIKSGKYTLFGHSVFWNPFKIDFFWSGKRLQWSCLVRNHTHRFILEPDLTLEADFTSISRAPGLQNCSNTATFIFQKMAMNYAQ